MKSSISHRLQGLGVGIAATIAVVIGIGVLNPPVPAPKVVTSVTQVTSHVAPQTEQEALDYLNSAGRLQRYVGVFDQAAITVAQALQAGRFGPVDKYDENKQSLTNPNYTGWGGIAAKGSNFYAWVYYVNGTIDFGKLVPGFSVQDGKYLLQIERDGGENYPYEVFLNSDGGATEVTSPDYVGGRMVNSNENEEFTYPTTMDALYSLDGTALTALNTVMSETFGPYWHTS